MMHLISHRDPMYWRARTRLDKYWGEWSAQRLRRVHPRPYETLENDGNLLVTVGATILWNLLIGAGGTVFSNANAYIGVGDGNGSVPTPTVGDTDLTAPTNKLRKVQDASFPTVSTNTCVFQSTYATTDANFEWREWGVFNASSAGTMLNHRGIDLGLKVNTASWQFKVTLSLA
jgi:hypothetical protein